jgi:hypothetical protein
MSMNSRHRKAEATYRSRKIVDLGDGSFVIQGRPMRKGGRAPSHHIQPHPQTKSLTCSCQGFDEFGCCKHTRAIENFVAERKSKVGPRSPSGPRYRATRPLLSYARAHALSVQLEEQVLIPAASGADHKLCTDPETPSS